MSSNPRIALQQSQQGSESLSVPTGVSGEISRLNVFSRRDERVGKYRIVAELGRGGAASVHLAVSCGTSGVQKLVVLKALLPELAEESQAASAFLDEARLAAQLNHPNVVQTYEVGVEGGRHVIVMEYLEGQSLSRIIRTAQKSGEPLADAIHLRILVEMLEGLDYAHELKGFDGRPLQLVHRDVSPQNVIVTYDGQVKILDFGIAKASTTSSHTAIGVLKGKIAYMSPEQMAGAEVDRRSDIYAAGCMLWAAAAGTKMWQDCPDVQVIREVLAGRAPSPKTVNPDCPPALERIVMKAIAPDPNKRYPTARALQTAIEEYAETLHQPVKQRDIGRYVTGMFAETRAAFTERMERELVAVLSDDMSVNIDIDDAAPATARAETTPQTRDKSVSIDVGSPVTNRSTGKRWLVGLTLLALLAAGAVAITGANKKLVTEASTSALVSRPIAPALNPSPSSLNDPNKAAKRVVVRFQVDPPHAHLVVDGSLLAGERMEMTMLSDGKLHEVRADAEGYEAVTRRFEVSSPITLEINLPHKSETSKHASQRIPRVSRAPAAAVTPPPATPPTPATPAKANACENPFFVDAEGIKRVRPGCM